MVAGLIVDNKFDCARRVVPHGFCYRLSRITDRSPGFRSQIWRGGFFKQLLISPLHRTLAGS